MYDTMIWGSIRPRVRIFDWTVDHPDYPRHSYPDSRHGLFGNVFAIPDGLGNSREAVRAPEARGVHNVDGSDVTVAVLESGIGFRRTIS